MEGVTWEQFDASSADSAQFVFIGKDSGANDLFVGRADLDGNLTPGHFSLDNGNIWLAVDGEEQAVDAFEYLVNSGDYDWIQAGDGEVPSNAVPCGKTSDGEALFLGRCEHEDGIVMGGFIQQSKSLMFMPFDGTVFEKTSYDVLVKK